MIFFMGLVAFVTIGQGVSQKKTYLPHIVLAFEIALERVVKVALD